MELSLDRESTPAPAPDANAALIGEIMRPLASTLDYNSSLGEIARVVADRLDCSCVIDVFEPGGTAEMAQVLPHLRDVAAATLAPVIAEVLASGDAVVSVQPANLARRATTVVGRARRRLEATWLVCAPLMAPSMLPLGTFTIFGASDQDSDEMMDLARDVARLMAIAVANGRLYREALAAAREREHVLSLVAHELRNPLAVVLMSTARARAGAPGEPRCPCSQRELDLIFRSAKRMQKLVSDLLDLASIDAGRLPMRPAACALAPLLHGAICDMGPLASAAGVALIDDLAENLPVAWVDGDRIVQVLVNLLANAIKFTPRGGRVRVRATQVERDVVVAVEDSGSGIAPGDLEHVFDRFWQASDTAKLGTGLGLEICKSIVELSGGRLWAQSTIGIGTTFYFSVPVAG